MAQQIDDIAVIAGDGIGKAVMPEGLRVLDVAAQRFGVQLNYTPIEWASCDCYATHGQMMPDDWKAPLFGMDAIYFGAVGWPDTVPDHISLWRALLKFRREFDPYVNLRPARLLDGVPCPLANRKPGDIDFMIVRENTEGEYTAVGGVMYEGTDRVLTFAFDVAQQRSRKHVTVVTKSNGIAVGMPWCLRQEHGPSHRHDLVGRADAGFPRSARWRRTPGARRHLGCHPAGADRRPSHQVTWVARPLPLT